MSFVRVRVHSGCHMIPDIGYDRKWVRMLVSYLLRVKISDLVPFTTSQTLVDYQRPGWYVYGVFRLINQLSELSITRKILMIWLKLIDKRVLLTVVSSLLTEARLYEFSRHLEFYLWYTLTDSPIGFWNRLNPTPHLLVEPRLHSTPRFDLWEAKFVKSSISFGV